jgi:Flp pilus assembly protein TadG
MSRFRPSSTAATAKQPISRRAAVGVSRFHEDQSGLISMASIVAALFFTVMIGMVANVGHAINHKMEVQNAADGVAYSSAVELARGMNAITAAMNSIKGKNRAETGKTNSSRGISTSRTTWRTPSPKRSSRRNRSTTM